MMTKKSNPNTPPTSKPQRDSRGRWMKNSSGNPLGRPTKVDTVGWDDNLHVFANTIVEVKINGEIVHMTRAEAINHKLYQDGMSRNNTRALLALKKDIETASTLHSSLIGRSLALLAELKLARSEKEEQDILARIDYASKAVQSVLQQIAIKNADYNRMLKAKAKRRGKAFLKKYDASKSPDLTLREILAKKSGY